MTQPPADNIQHLQFRVTAVAYQKKKKKYRNTFRAFIAWDVILTIMSS